MNLYFQIERLINYALQQKLINLYDVIYIRNQYYELFSLKHNAKLEVVYEHLEFPDQILNEIYACLELNPDFDLNNLGQTKDIIVNKVINILLPKPGQIINTFNEIKVNYDIHKALDWLYQFSIASFYIKMQNLSKNKHWCFKDEYIELEITINLSKPEKDPQEIAKAKLVAKQGLDKYPRCLLCIENEGYSGNYNHPARQNLRLLPLTLAGNRWYFQFSPYVYYNQHGIVINHEHTDMIINLNTFNAFFDFVDLMPKYIIGSNADIPIVGGSILTHDHYQVGKHSFPIEKALDRVKFNFTNYPNIVASIIDWPITTLRMVGSRSDLIRLIPQILTLWYEYSEVEIGLVSSTNGIRHNAVTPIMRKLSEDNYRLDLLLRNNRTSEDFPYGIFHPHRELHNIKKENIGLIEAMGLAILPGRLDSELVQIKELLLKNDISLLEQIAENHMLYKHKSWLHELLIKYQKFSLTTIEGILQHEIGHKFLAVLNDCGIFKQNHSLDKLVNKLIALT